MTVKTSLELSTHLIVCLILYDIVLYCIVLFLLLYVKLSAAIQSWLS